MRRSRRELMVQLSGDLPCRCQVNGRWFGVNRLLDAWRYGGRWWLGEAPRDHYLLELEDGRVAEITREGDEWFLIGTAD